MRMAMAKETAKPAAGAGGLYGMPWSRVVLIAGVVFVLLVGFGSSLLLDSVLAGDAKKEQESQQKRMQEDLRRHQEDLERRQVALDAYRTLEIQRTLASFQLVIPPAMEKLNQSLLGFSQDQNLTDANLAQNARAAREFGIALREALAMLRGFEAFLEDAEGDLKRISKGEYETPESISGLGELLNPYQEIAAVMVSELERFAGTDPARRQTVAEAVAILKDI
jgi:hypothetical protein